MVEDTRMSTEQIWRAVAAERASLAALLAPLPEADWDHPSLCDGWRVRDVVAHVVLSARADVGWILLNLVRAGGSLHRAIRDTAVRHADQVTTGQLLDELRDSIDARVTAFGTTPADRLMDLLVHGQDIALPLGIAREMPKAAAVVAIDRIWTTGAPFHARKKFAGCRLVATDAEWAAGDGPIITGPVAALLLAVTGRRQGWEQITGDAATLLAKQARP
ncbi:maleylpyruvate isomerase family mycothiol-dependent enzyme [Nocardia barduliensis]|uniref:maleylpyruvate isomerase family mycothiol-dependent enzyme n=1 Tax=Nocardia barduliensis TaxID=2736643 RepID=UPI001FE3D72C|nr:maleylpyruvate isomerase family mycothiol-dependent enzyme [Nocardia barduliensis]